METFHCLSLIFHLTPFFAVGLTTLLIKHLPALQDNNDTLNLNIFLNMEFKDSLKVTTYTWNFISNNHYISNYRIK